MAEVYVNSGYTADDSGYGVTKFSDFATAVSNTGSSDVIVVENSVKYSSSANLQRAVVVKEGATWTITDPNAGTMQVYKNITVEAGGHIVANFFKGNGGTVTFAGTEDKPVTFNVGTKTTGNFEMWAGATFKANYAQINCEIMIVKNNKSTIDNSTITSTKNVELAGGTFSNVDLTVKGGSASARQGSIYGSVTFTNGSKLVAGGTGSYNADFINGLTLDGGSTATFTGKKDTIAKMTVKGESTVTFNNDVYVGNSFTVSDGSTVNGTGKVYNYGTMTVDGSDVANVTNKSGAYLTFRISGSNTSGVFTAKLYDGDALVKEISFNIINATSGYAFVDGLEDGKKYTVKVFNSSGKDVTSTSSSYKTVTYKDSAPKLELKDGAVVDSVVNGVRCAVNVTGAVQVKTLTDNGGTINVNADSVLSLTEAATINGIVNVDDTARFDASNVDLVIGADAKFVINYDNELALGASSGVIIDFKDGQVIDPSQITLNTNLVGYSTAVNEDGDIIVKNNWQYVDSAEKMAAADNKGFILFGGKFEITETDANAIDWQNKVRFEAGALILWYASSADGLPEDVLEHLILKQTAVDIVKDDENEISTLSLTGATGHYVDTTLDTDLEIISNSDNADIAEIRSDIAAADNNIEIVNNQNLRITGSISGADAVVIYNKTEAVLNGGSNDIGAKVSADSIVMTNDGHAVVDFSAGEIEIENNSANTIENSWIGYNDAHDAVVAENVEITAAENSDGVVSKSRIAALEEVTIADQTVTDSNIAAGILNVYGETTLGEGNTYNVTNFEFGSDTETVNATIDMTNVDTTNFCVQNGTVTLVGKMGDNDIYYFAPGAYFGNPKHGDKDGLASTTNIGTADNKDVLIHINQMTIEGDNEHTLNVYGKIIADASMYCKQNAIVNIYNNVTVGNNDDDNPNNNNKDFQAAAKKVLVQGEDVMLSVSGKLTVASKYDYDAEMTIDQADVEATQVIVGSSNDEPEKASRTGNLIIKNGGTLTADTMSLYDDGISSITIDAAGFTGGAWRAIDLAMSGDDADALQQAITISNVAEGVDVIYAADGDIVFSKVDTSTLYVNGAWADKDPDTDGVQNYEVGEEVASGKYYDINAFDDVTNAMKVAKNNSVVNFVGDVTLSGETNNYGLQAIYELDGKTITWTADSSATVDVAVRHIVLHGEGTLNIGENITLKYPSNKSVTGIGEPLFIIGSFWGGDDRTDKVVVNLDGRLDLDNKVSDGSVKIRHNGVLNVSETASINAGYSIRVRGGELNVVGIGKDAEEAQLFSQRLELNGAEIENGKASVIDIKNSYVKTTKDIADSFDAQDGRGYGYAKSFSFENSKVETVTLKLGDSITAFEGTDTDFSVTTLTNNAKITLNDSSFNAQTVTNSGSVKVDGGEFVAKTVEMKKRLTISGIEPATGKRKVQVQVLDGNGDVIKSYSYTIFENATSFDIMIDAAGENYKVIYNNEDITGSATAKVTDGVFNLAGGNFTAETLTNNGTITVGGGSLSATTLTNSGTVTMTGGTLDADSFTNNGTVEVNGGKLDVDVVSGSGAIDIYGTTELDIENVNKHIIRINKDGSSPAVITGSIANMACDGLYGSKSMFAYNNTTFSNFTMNVDEDGNVVKGGVLKTNGKSIVFKDNTYIALDNLQISGGGEIESGSTIYAIGVNVYDHPTVKNTVFTVNGELKVDDLLVTTAFYSEKKGTNPNSNSKFVVGETGVISDASSAAGRFDLQLGHIVVYGYVNQNWNSGGGNAYIGNDGYKTSLTIDGTYAADDNNKGKFINSGDQVLEIFKESSVNVISNGLFSWKTVKNNGAVNVNGSTLVSDDKFTNNGSVTVNGGNFNADSVTNNGTVKVNGGTFYAETFTNNGSVTISGVSTINATITGNVASVAKGAALTLNDVVFVGGEDSYTMMLDVYDASNIKSVNGAVVIGNAVAGYSVKIGDVIYGLVDNNSAGLSFEKLTDADGVSIIRNYTGALDIFTKEYTIEAKEGTATLNVSKGQSVTIAAVTKHANGGVTNVNVKDNASLTLGTLNEHGFIEAVGKITTGKNVQVKLGEVSGTNLNTTINLGKNNTAIFDSIDMKGGSNTLSIGSNSYVEVADSDNANADGYIKNAKTIKLANGTAANAKKGTDDVFTTLDVTGDIIAPAMNNSITLGNYAKLLVSGDLVNSDVNVGTTIKAGNCSEVIFGKPDGNGNIIGGEVTSLAGLSIGTEGVFKAASVSGTEKNNTISLGKGADMLVVDEISGVETITIGAKGRLNAGAVTGVNKVTVAKGAELDIDGILEGTAKNDTVAFGNGSEANFNGIDLGDGKDTLKVGNNSVLIVGEYLPNQVEGDWEIADIDNVEIINLGSLGQLAAKDITDVNKLTAANGTADDTTKLLVTGKVTGTAKNDTIALGNRNGACFVGGIDLAAGNDTIKIGSNSSVAGDAINFGDGNDTLTIGKNAKVSVGNIIFGEGTKDTLTLGKDAELFTTGIEGVETINADKSSAMIINNGKDDVNFDGVKGSWNKATIIDIQGELADWKDGEIFGAVYGNGMEVDSIEFSIGAGDKNNLHIDGITKGNCEGIVVELLKKNDNNAWELYSYIPIGDFSGKADLEEGSYAIAVKVDGDDLEKKDYSFKAYLA